MAAYDDLLEQELTEQLDTAGPGREDEAAVEALLHERAYNGLGG